MSIPEPHEPCNGPASRVQGDGILLAVVLSGPAGGVWESAPREIGGLDESDDPVIPAGGRHHRSRGARDHAR